ncbi:putative secologanin synthase [Helianthus annuus]|nr:putative secologanin synthase [Helianthus annuus]
MCARALLFENVEPIIIFLYLKYIYLHVNMILNEVLWLYPVAPVLRQLLHEKAKLGNLTLPAGTIIQLNTLFFHHDKEIWGEDASKFNLERF